MRACHHHQGVRVHHLGESSSGRERARARGCHCQGEHDGEGDELSSGESKDKGNGEDPSSCCWSCAIIGFWCHCCHHCQEGEGEGTSSSLDDRDRYIIVAT